MSSRIRLLTFDITNTILKVKGSVGAEYSQVAESCGIYLHPDAIDKIYRNVWGIMRRTYPNYGREHGLTSRHWWAGLVHQVFITAGYQGDRKLLTNVSDKLFTRFEEAFSWEVLPQSREVLSNLRTKDDVKIAAVSNFDERLEGTLRRMGLLEYFDFLVTSVNAGYEKPHPGIYKSALDIARVLPEEGIHVGDEMENDYLTARKAGMVAFLLDRQGQFSNQAFHNVEEGFLITDLNEVYKFVHENHERHEMEKENICV